jgi:hypothetical protein
MTHRIASARLGTWSSWGAVLLAATPPIIGLTATSGSFDVFSLTYQVAVFILVVRLLRDPTAENAALLWITALM